MPDGNQPEPPEKITPEHLLTGDASINQYRAQEGVTRRSAATTAPCTATFRDVRGTIRACNKAAGHYDETREPIWPTPLGPPDPGGLHTDGESIWHDQAHGATPHEDESE